MKCSHSLSSTLDFALELARGAGDVVMRYFRNQPSTERKPDGSFVTAADRASESFLRDRILAAHPHDGVLGEEFGEQSGSTGRRWIVDPIDGTFSFVCGVPLFGILIGVEIDGEPSVGVAHFPALGETIGAARGLGCALNGSPVHTTSTHALGEAVIAATEPLSAEALVRRARAVRGWSDSYAYLLVASGRVDVAFDPEAKEWDCAALLPIVEEAGGTFTDWNGVRTTRGGNALATNGPLFAEVLPYLRTTPM